MSIDYLSPAQAATRAKCGRATIMRAIKSGELKAVKDNDARWRIDPDLLDDWAGQRRSPDRSRDDQSPPVTVDTTPDSTLNTSADTQGESVRQQIEIASLTAERDGLINRLADAHAEHERLRADAKQLRADADQLRADADRLRADADRFRAELAHKNKNEPLLARIRRSLTGKGA